MSRASFELPSELLVQLTYAVQDHDSRKVEELLTTPSEQGQDLRRLLAAADDDPDGYSGNSGGWTGQPLKLVVFRISDCTLTDEGLDEFLRITRLLLDNGAPTTHAMMLARERYGRWTPPSQRNDDPPPKLFHQVIDLIGLRHCAPPSFVQTLHTVRLVANRLGPPWPDVINFHVIPILKAEQFKSALSELEWWWQSVYQNV